MFKKRALFVFVSLALLFVGSIFQVAAVDRRRAVLTGTQVLHQLSFSPVERYSWPLQGMKIPAEQPLKALFSLLDGIGGIHFFEVLLIPAAFFLFLFICSDLKISGAGAILGGSMLLILELAECTTLDLRFGVLALLLAVSALTRNVLVQWFLCLGILASAVTSSSFCLPFVVLSFLVAAGNNDRRSQLTKCFLALLVGILVTPSPLSVFPFEIQTPNFHLYKPLLIIFWVSLLLLIISPKKMSSSWKILFASSFALTLLNERSLPLFLLALAFSISFLADGRKWSVLEERLMLSRKAWIFFGIFGMAFVSFSSILPRGLRPPLDLSGVLKTNPKRILNDKEVAAELQDFRIATFVDERKISAQKEVNADYETLSSLRERWEPVLAKWKFDGAVLRESSPLAHALVELKNWKKNESLGRRLRVTPREDINEDYAFFVPPKGEN